MSKVCVYCIAKNEEAFVERFMAQARHADLVVVGDTGSTDGTVEAFRRCGAVVHNITVSPWRFDAARNQVIDLIPAEYDCLFSIDVDETLETPDWKEKVLQAWVGNNRVRYWYSWSLKPDGTPDRRFVYDKIHSRDFRWVSPVHEVLELAPGGVEKGGFAEIELYHRPDCSKSRGSYLGLLEIAVKERPHDDRILHYYGRELYFVGRNAEAILVLLKHSELEHAWAAERAASCRMAGECSTRLGRIDEAEWFYTKGVSICPGEREPLVALAKFYLSKGAYEKCYRTAMAAVNIPPVHDHYLVDPYAHNEGPYDLAGVSAWWAGNKEEGQRLMEQAASLNPKDQRLQDNLAYFTPDPKAQAEFLVRKAIQKWHGGSFSEARLDFFSAQKLDPNNDLVIQNRTWFPNPIVVKPEDRKQGVYAGAKSLTMIYSIGIGITTTSAREEYFTQCASNVWTYSGAAKLSIARDVNGVGRAKNKNLIDLQNCDFIFLFDDDAWPIKHDWEDYFINSMVCSGESHLLYLTEKLHGKPTQKNGLLSFPNCGGVFMAFDNRNKTIINKVGAFNCNYKGWGFEHAGYSSRIYRAGLISEPFLMARETADYIYSLDYDKGNQIKSSVSDSEKNENYQHNQRLYIQETTTGSIYLPFE